MPMSQGVMSDLIKTELEATTDVQDPLELQKLTDAIASGVVTHITAAALVTVTSVSGVTPGGGVSGPGTGTIS